MGLIEILLGVLISLLGFIGHRIFSRLDDLTKLLRESEGTLHDKTNRMSDRITAIETRCGIKCKEGGYDGSP